MKRCAPVRKRRPDRISKLLLCEAIIAPLENHLRETGRDHREEAGLIAGYIVGGSIGVATTVLLPYTENATAGCELPLDVTLDCSETMARAGQVLLAQVHTHPGRGCGHSGTDNHWAFSDCAGLFSLVVPCFGRWGLRRLFDGSVAVHERLTTGKWQLLTPVEVRQRFLIVPSFRAVF
jgi:hypothetical protein